ncbi:MAG: exodeoxyribonuclease V subunit gamma [Clostridia bacterium]|nr:exodeoxyribonuclease V subunit gamma [Clostridia bacterium]
MSYVKIIYGPSGSGKTFNAINDFLAVSREGNALFPTRHCFLVVPEQQTVEIEKQLLKREKINGLISYEIISFNRLVYRILQDANVKTGAPLTSSLSGMLTVKAVNDLDGSLVCFRDIIDNPDAISKLSATLRELQKYNIDCSNLEFAADHMSADNKRNNLSPARLRELSLILERYDGLLKEGGFETPAALAERAIVLIRSGKSIVTGSYLYVDSFTGFTETELGLLRAFAVACDRMNIYLYREDSKNPVFKQANETYNVIYNRLSAIPGCSVETVGLDASDYKQTRFSGSQSLYHLSRFYGEYLRKDIPHPEPSDIKIYACADLYHEIQNVCDNIISLVKSGRYRYDDIALAVPSADDTLYLIDAVFREKNIPVFIDARIEMSGHAIIRYIDAFLNIICGSNEIESFIAMLKTGLLKTAGCVNDDVDRLETLADKYNCKSLAAFGKIIRHHVNKYLSKNAPVPSYLRLGRAVIGLFESAEGSDSLADQTSEEGFKIRAAGAVSVADVIELVYAFAEKTGLDRYGENLKQETADDIIFIRVWNVFTDILAECRNTLGNVKRRGWRKLVEYTSRLLAAAVSCYEIGFIPYSESHVKVGDFTRSGYINKKVLFIIGANEGDFPPAPPSAGILKDAERKAIRESGKTTAFTDEEQIFFTGFKVYTVLCAPSEKLYISYSQVDENGDPKEPSEVVERISAMFGEIKAAFYRNAADEAVEAPADEDTAVRISPDTVKALLKVKKNFNVAATSVESLVKCPYRYLMEKILRLREYEKGFVKQTSTGSYYHALLEHTMRAAGRKGRFADMNENELKAYLEDASARFLNDEQNAELKFSLELNARDRVVIDRALDFAEKELLNLQEISGSICAEPAYFEQAFGPGLNIDAVRIPAEEPSGVDTVINGKIDRIDKVAVRGGGTEYLVIDYKSGNAASKGDKIQSEDENVQLKLYYTALKRMVENSINRGGTPDGRLNGELTSDDKILIEKDINSGENVTDSFENGTDSFDNVTGFDGSGFRAALAYYRYGADSDNENLHVLNTFVDKSDTAFSNVAEASSKEGVRVNVKTLDLDASAGDSVENIRRHVGELFKGTFVRATQAADETAAGGAARPDDGAQAGSGVKNGSGAQAGNGSQIVGGADPGKAKPKDSDNCRYCGYFNICNSGRRLDNED